MEDALKLYDVSSSVAPLVLMPAGSGYTSDLPSDAQVDSCLKDHLLC